MASGISHPCSGGAIRPPLVTKRVMPAAAQSTPSIIDCPASARCLEADGNRRRIRAPCTRQSLDWGRTGSTPPTQPILSVSPVAFPPSGAAVPYGLRVGRVIQDFGDHRSRRSISSLAVVALATARFVGHRWLPKSAHREGFANHRDPLRGSGGGEGAVPSRLQARREPRALRTGFRSTPMPETSTSQTSPCFIALVDPGVPV